jgi:hypothetical protein
MQSRSALVLLLATACACAGSSAPRPSPAPSAGGADEIKLQDSAAQPAPAKSSTTSAPAQATPAPDSLGTPGKPTVQLVEGFLGPWAAIHDEAEDVYLVSNTNGDPLVDDGNGFISRVSPQGNVQELRFIDGGKAGVSLSAPKGMVIFGDLLAVADLRALRIFNRKTGKPVRSIEIDGATALTDVALMPDGTLVVSDAGQKLDKGVPVPTGTDALYRVDREGGYSVIVRSPKLARPHGVMTNADSIDISTGGAAALLRYGLDGRERGMRTSPTGALEGLVTLPGAVRAFASRDCRCVYTVNSTYQFTPLMGGLDGPGDLGVDLRRRKLLIPLSGPSRLMIAPY